MPDVVLPSKWRRAIYQADLKLKPYRDQRQYAHREYRGRYHGSDLFGPDPQHRKPLNLINRGADVLIAHLVAKAPEAKITARNLRFRGEALKTEMALNHLAWELDRWTISRRVLLDALLGCTSIVLTGLRAGEDLYQIHGRLYDPGQPYIKPISLNDYVADPTAREPDEFAWEGHRWRASRRQLQESGLFNPDILANLPALHEQRPGMNRDQHAYEVIDGRHLGAGADAYLWDQIELIDGCFYTNEGPVKVTMPAAEGTPNVYLRETLWQTPERSPYEKLEFRPMPEHPFAVSWADVVREQQDLASSLISKLVQEVVNSRRLGIVGGNASETEVEMLKTAPDRSILQMRNPGSFVSADLGGALPDLSPMIDKVLSWHNASAGNPDLLQGMAKAGTATEFQGNQAAAGTILGDLQAVHERFEGRITKRLAWLLQTDPFIQLPLTHRIPGAEWIELQYDAQTREADHLDFTYEVRSRSMESQDPAVKARRLIEFISLFAQSGAIDVLEAAKLLGREWGVEGLPEMVRDEQMAMEREMAFSGVPQPSQGQPTGIVGNPTRGLGPVVPSQRGQQTSSMAVSQSARSTRMPAAA